MGVYKFVPPTRKYQGQLREVKKPTENTYSRQIESVPWSVIWNLKPIACGVPSAKREKSVDTCWSSSKRTALGFQPCMCCSKPTSLRLQRLPQNQTSSVFVKSALLFPVVVHQQRRWLG